MRFWVWWLPGPKSPKTRNVAGYVSLCGVVPATPNTSKLRTVYCQGRNFANAGSTGAKVVAVRSRIARIGAWNDMVWGGYIFYPTTWYW